ncbi:2'-5' RNA ligase family protein [Streptomyces caeni]|uniref:2'-5' RNA ligase family protein n=1 Tax=Streptomyces caeni TaxID=2307231 RepID=A0ABW4IKR0_9ACTN
MADDDAQGFQAGQSGLIVRVPEAEPLVRAWRDRLGPSARAGVPAHVTVLFPFLDVSRIDEGVCAAIGEVLGRHQSFKARFDHCGRFPGVLYLAPEPDTRFRRLTEAIVERWPENPPFGGQFNDAEVREVTTAPRAEFQHPASGHGTENALVRPVIGVLGPVQPGRITSGVHGPAWLAPDRVPVPGLSQ